MLINRSIIRTLVAGSSCVLLSQCNMVGVDYSSPKMTVPDGWTRALAQDSRRSTPRLEGWWRSLNDSNLNRLISKVKTHNKDIKVAAQSISIARLQRGISNAQLLPKASATATTKREQESEFTSRSNSSMAGLYNSKIDASWEADVFGGLRRNVEFSQRNAEASYESYRDLLVMLYAETALNYIDYRSLQARISVANSQISSQQATVRLTKELFDAGINSKIDYLQAQSDLSSTRAQIPSLKAQLIKSRNRLAVLTGQYPHSVTKLLSRSKAIPTPRSLASLGLPTNLLRARPDIRKAERELAAQTAKIGIAESELYPKFSLLGQFSLESRKLGKVVDGRSIGYAFGPSIQWKIFNAGAIRKAVSIEKARTEQALLRYEKSVLVAVEEVENSMASIAYERDRHRELSKALARSQEATDLVKGNYREGIIDFQRVLDTERSTFRLKDQLAISKGEIAKHYVRLYKALGGGTEMSKVWIDSPRIKAIKKSPTKTFPDTTQR